MISNDSVVLPAVKALSTSDSFKRLENDAEDKLNDISMCAVEGTENWKAVVYDESVSHFLIVLVSPYLSLTIFFLSSGKSQ